MSRSRTLTRGIIQRATILVLGFQGLLNSQIAEQVGLNRQQVGIWRQRWREAWESLCVWECTDPHRFRERILEVLADAPRPGSPGTFTAEQVSQIIAVACESPKLSGRPINRWTHRELRDEVVARKIVTTISKAQVGRYLLQAADQRLQQRMAAARLSFTWLGVRKTLTAEQKAQAAETFGAQDSFLSAGKKLLDTSHPAFREVTAVRGQVQAYFRNVSLPYRHPSRFPDSAHLKCFERSGRRMPSAPQVG